jgi:hypothetical protein
LYVLCQWLGWLLTGPAESRGSRPLSSPSSALTGLPHSLAVVGPESSGTFSCKKKIIKVNQRSDAMLVLVRNLININKTM